MKAKKSFFSQQLPRPSCSKENALPISPSIVDLSTYEDEEEELCCICDKRMPPAVNLAFVVEFAQWAQCDKCSHWTHLKYCTKIRVVRRESAFLCPHCDPETTI